MGKHAMSQRDGGRQLGRYALTGGAAVALAVAGGSGVAFAGDAPTGDSGPSSSSHHDNGDHSGSSDHHGHGKHCGCQGQHESGDEQSGGNGVGGGIVDPITDLPGMDLPEAPFTGDNDGGDTTPPMPSADEQDSSTGDDESGVDNGTPSADDSDLTSTDESGAPTSGSGSGSGSEGDATDDSSKTGGDDDGGTTSDDAASGDQSQAPAAPMTESIGDAAMTGA